MLEFKRTQNPTLHAPIPILGALLEGVGISKDLPILRPRFDGRNETQNLPGRGRGGWIARPKNRCAENVATDAIKPAEYLQMALPSPVTSEHQAAENRGRDGTRYETY
ncbi:hypothetical protein AVEN_91399-1 [Araneus ventricosus]|uniref:Uncharacterized protein n=1 Tax=Araneus ventricosus TaxID=182803 RepID=A0A4Y2KDB1_ARAVE|nr:hypothetical protein AVEN_91399-1 [Araneus ventricosus]